jgi:predicted nucleic acid-binding protein
LHAASDKLTLLDACAVINLYATGQMAEILECIEGRLGIASTVMRESLYVDGRDENAERERIDLAALVDAGSLEIVSPETDSDLYTFLGFAIDLGDGEAMTLALAINRDAGVVTDDRKAIHLAADSLTIIPSLELVSIWFNARRIRSDQQRDTLIAIQTRASYVPGRSHPYRGWWDRIMDQM